ncbi:MAG: helix-turn-helix transcriptional regulator [Coprothermobacterota bacterium]|nr:helix-turn-helix transcriptional regulator [Coprothermobacterota bacterium]
MALAREKIHEIRINRSLSQTQLADLMGYNPSTISRIEQGVLKPSLRFLQRMADTFGLSMPYLLDSSEPLYLDEERKFDLNVVEPGLRTLALDEELCKMFDITTDEIVRLAAIRFRTGVVDKQEFLGLLFYLRSLDS